MSFKEQLICWFPGLAWGEGPCWSNVTELKDAVIPTPLCASQGIWDIWFTWITTFASVTMTSKGGKSLKNYSLWSASSHVKIWWNIYEIRVSSGDINVTMMAFWWKWYHFFVLLDFKIISAGFQLWKFKWKSIQNTQMNDEPLLCFLE